MSKRDQWQKAMYDERFARATIASPEYARIARVEADFLVKAMALSAGNTLLDVPCGTGRHARRFAARGLRVTAIDLNAALVRTAKKRAGRVAYAVGDMAELGKYRGKFDAVVNLFTSFGYFASDRKNADVLHGMVAALKPGGRLAIHVIDRDWVLKNFIANSWGEKKGLFTLEARRYDPKTRRIEAQTVLIDRKSGKARNYYHQTRLYSKSELVRLMRTAGLARVQVYGDTDGSLYRKGETSHPIYVGWKV